MDNLVAESGEAQIDGLDFHYQLQVWRLRPVDLLTYFHQVATFIMQPVAIK